MKSLYVKPVVDMTPVYAQPLMAGSEQGVIGQGDDMGKEHDDVVDDDEEGPIKNAPFSNVDNKKGWD